MVSNKRWFVAALFYQLLAAVAHATNVFAYSSTNATFAYMLNYFGAVAIFLNIVGLLENNNE